MGKHVEGKYGRKPGGKYAKRRHRPFQGVMFDNLGNPAGCWCFLCETAHRWAEPCRGKERVA